MATPNKPNKSATTTTTAAAAPNKPATPEKATVAATTDQERNGPPFARPDAAKTSAVATPDKPVAPVSAVATTPAKPDPADPATYKGLPRLRFYSVEPGKEDYCVRILPIFLDKYGPPKDPWGNTMALRPKQLAEIGGDGKPAKVRRIEAKEAEAKLLASMTDAEKLIYAKSKREANQAAREAKVAAQKAALMAELRKELEGQGLKIVQA
jgi:hypothetical protein